MASPSVPSEATSTLYPAFRRLNRATSRPARSSSINKIRRSMSSPALLASTRSYHDNLLECLLKTGRQKGGGGGATPGGERFSAARGAGTSTCGPSSDAGRSLRGCRFPRSPRDRRPRSCRPPPGRSPSRGWRSAWSSPPRPGPGVLDEPGRYPHLRCDRPGELYLEPDQDIHVLRIGKDIRGAPFRVASPPKGAPLPNLRRGVGSGPGRGGKKEKEENDGKEKEIFPKSRAGSARADQRKDPAKCLRYRSTEVFIASTASPENTVRRFYTASAPLAQRSFRRGDISRGSPQGEMPSDRNPSASGRKRCPVARKRARKCGPGSESRLLKARSACRRFAARFFLSPPRGEVLRSPADMGADRFAGSFPRSA